ncbi:MAG TPA: hypothetical protein VID47_19540 [Actinomycetota bacterium]|jgi:hypothetical protein
MSSRSLLRAVATAGAAALLAVSCSSNGPKPKPTEGTGDAGFPTTAPFTSVATPEPPVTQTPPTEPPSTTGDHGGGGDSNGVFLTEGGTYQITSDRMIYIARQKYLVVSPRVWFGSTSTPKFPKGAYLATDTGAFLSEGGTWTNASGRDLKDHLTRVDAGSVLAELRTLPISTWHYRAEAAGVRHLGPMAEGFFRAFGLGQDDQHIATVDEEGVALAALQALARRSAQQDRVIGDMRAELGRLVRRVRRLEASRHG